MVNIGAANVKTFIFFVDRTHISWTHKICVCVFRGQKALRCEMVSEQMNAFCKLNVTRGAPYVSSVVLIGR